MNLLPSDSYVTKAMQHVTRRLYRRQRFLVFYRALVVLAFLTGCISPLRANQPPVAVDDESYAYENQVQTGDVSLNDYDPDGDPLTFTILVHPNHGTLVMQPNGQFTYTPNPYYYGFDFATYQVCDPHGACATAQIELATLFVNDPPSINDELFYIEAGLPFTGSVAANDYDLDNEPIFYSVISPPNNVVSFSLSLFGIVTLTPEPGFTGTIVLVYSGCDPCDVCGVGMAVFIVSANSPPVTIDDQFATTMNTAVSGSVATNDYDPDGHDLVFSIVTPPSTGTLVLQPNGQFTYTPVPFYHGTVTAVYKACDVFNSCSAATLTINVAFVNFPPVAGDDYFEMDEDAVLTANVSLNDSDPNGDVLSYSITQPPAIGTLTIDANTGTIVYTPPADWFGDVSAVYQACDPHGGCDGATIFIAVHPVNDVPVATDGVISLDEDTSYTGSLSVFATDVEDDDLLFSLVSGTMNGTLELNADGAFTYTPFPDYSGTDSFVFQACDSEGACAQAAIHIVIHEVNDPPMVSGETFEMDEDELLNGDVSLNDSDPEGQPLTYSVITLPLHGNLVLLPDGQFTYAPTADFHGQDSFVYDACDPEGACGQATATIVILPVNDPPVATDNLFTMEEDGLLEGDVSINDFDVDGDLLSYLLLVPPASGTLMLGQDGSFTYSPAADFHGVISFGYLVCDPSGACDAAVVAITVTPVNDAPVAAGESYIMDEDTLLEGTVAGNDFDVDGDELTYSLVQGPQHGIITLLANGSFVYSPPLNFHGEVQVMYSVCDPHSACDQAVLVITVNPVNDPPVVNGENISVLMNVPYSGNLALNDFDVDGDILVYSLVEAPAHGELTLATNGTYTYVPEADYFGPATAVYTACDQHNACGTATLQIQVLLVNSPPVASDEFFQGLEDEILTGDAGMNDSDPDGHELVYTLVTPPVTGQLVLTSSGQFVFTPPADWHGQVYAVYEACDPFGACDQAQLTIIITPVNDPPVVVGEEFTTLEDEPLIGSVADNDYDVDGDELSYSVLVPPTHGQLEMESNGSFVFVPDLNYYGTVHVTYEACDPSGLCGQALMVIEVLPVNDPPVALNDYFELPINGVVSGNVGDNDEDVDNDPLTFSLIQSVQHGVLTLGADGSFFYTANEGFSGTDFAVYAVCDPDNTCDQATVFFAVGAINTPPIITDAVGESCAIEPWSLDLDLIVFDYEDSNDLLQFTLLQGTHESWSLDAVNRVLSFEPTEGVSGVVQAYFEVCDASQSSECSNGMVSLLLTDAVSPVVLTEVVTHVRCYGENSGSIAIHTDGTTDQINWDTGASGQVISGLSPGAYHVVVSRPGACANTLQLNYEISQPEELLIQGLAALPINGSAGGSTDFEVVGGTEPYIYQWIDMNSGEVISTEKVLAGLIDPLQAGNYQLVVTDANGCVAESAIVVTGISEEIKGELFAVMPNPASSFIWLQQRVPGAGILNLQVVDVSGREVYRQTSVWIGHGGRFEIPLDGIRSGTYFLRISGDFGQEVFRFAKF